MSQAANRRTFILKVCSAGALLALAGGLWSAEASPTSVRHSATSRPTTATTITSIPATTIPAPKWPQPAWVSVPVAGVWDHLNSARPIDAPVLNANPRVAPWLASMNLAERTDLDNRLATQALLDEPVTVLGQAGAWSHVLVDEQRGAVYPSGIAGWIPSDQLTFTTPPAAADSVTVAVPFAGRLSYGTRLPVVGSSGSRLVVATPAGDLEMPARDVRSGKLPASGEAVVQQAELFLGLPYLWAGTSAYGFDCSGLTYLIYRQFGVRLPRDAADQALAGWAVPRSDLEPGDLVFFDFGQGIDHVGIYAGKGMMIDSPKTGADLEVVNLSTSWMAPYFAGARRYLG